MIDKAALAQLLRVEYEFTLRPVAVPGDLRPIWRLATICLMLRNCWGTTATLKQLHVLNWALRDVENRETFLLALGDGAPVHPVVRIEPSLNRAVDFAIGEKLVGRSSTRLALTQRGADFAKRIDSDSEVLVDEKDFFSRIGKKVTAAMIERILVWNSLL